MVILSEPLFPTQDNNGHVYPIVSHSKEELQNILDEEVQLKRELSKMTIDTSKSLSFIPIMHGMFNIFKEPQEIEIENGGTNEQEDDNTLQLISTGSLSILDESNQLNLTTPALQVNVPEYRAKRRKVEQILSGLLNPSTEHTSEKEATPTMTDDGLEEDAQLTTAPSSPIQQTHKPKGNDWHPGTETETGVQVYEYPARMVPVFATPGQIEKVAEITESAKQNDRLIGTDFRKVIDYLNFTLTDYDASIEDAWSVSGKLIFIKDFLNNLADKDMTIVILTKGLGEETSMYELIRECLKLACTRVGNVLDDDWNGEYGVFVKTRKSEEILRASEQQLFTHEADLIICLDILIEDNIESLSLINNKNQKKRPYIVWLVTVGSLEERIFRLMDEKKITFSQCNSQLSELSMVANNWPQGSLEDGMTRNMLAALNLTSWLVDYKGECEYQYRSKIELPNSLLRTTPETSAVAGSVVTTTTTTTIAADEEASDMELSSDIDTEESNRQLNTEDTRPVLSSQLLSFLENSIFPTCDFIVNKKTTPEGLDSNDVALATTILNTTGSNYINELKTLKLEFEQKFNTIREKYLEETKKTFFRTE
ncbi:hypothetical protein G6F70_000292 [Rhizopus microsporus]|uniref:Uncharacterized protein n=2 Tax=Rhizopus TaxID=4842 RepID=A0A367K9A1_RHIAZ|nr:hypothetical protein G6F71_001207 [Rhizopus microsporus]KAG1204688.1 hypothetical protein G6F70_000292 [Rhizopus microsporus]KAG1216180.1 hypothetical protein G6F69_000371 [Rhizopus microsporus]ORE18450.1 hypothetical protein BCV71DRAFT_116046 [Rhizopus microsporus]RCH98747.1 hypothetical protein CU097_014098 [Rhizopus azygosporus]